MAWLASNSGSAVNGLKGKAKVDLKGARAAEETSRRHLGLEQETVFNAWGVLLNELCSLCGHQRKLRIDVELLGAKASGRGEAFRSGKFS
jgi:hypothetical protein